MEYKGIKATVRYDNDMLYGKFEIDNYVVSFHGKSPNDLELAFEEAVDDFLENREFGGDSDE